MKSLTPVVLEGKLLTPAERFARAMTAVAARIDRGDLPGQRAGSGAGTSVTEAIDWAALSRTLSSEARLLQAATQLARGDTARATVALFALAHEATTSAAGRAAMMLATVTATRKDTAARITATALAYVLNSGSNVAEKGRYYQTLQSLYPAYVRAHGVMRDIVPHVMDDVPAPATPLALDRYLDRQFGVVYDRTFPVERATLSSTPAGRAPRIVIAEYLTGVFCGPCWVKDRAFNAVARRYPADRVIPLAYHDYYPVTSTVDKMWTRAHSWYPESNGMPGMTVLPARLARTPRGEKLADNEWVDGIALPRSEPGLKESEARALFRVASTVIDSVLLQPPNASVRLRVTRAGGTITLTAMIDSVRGERHRLAFRAVLVQDTVTLRGGTNRRVYINVVRAVAYSDSLPLGLPLTLTPSSATITHHFDIDAINQRLVHERDPLLSVRAMYGKSVDQISTIDLARLVKERAADLALFPDDRDWRVEPDRLFVVAFVQDLETGEILQAAMERVPGSSTDGIAVR
jgi:hypothetical protein